MTSYPWEPRREGEATADYLARVLDESGLPELAANARAKHYDDYFCPPEVDDGLNMHRLIGDLQSQISPTAVKESQRYRRIKALQDATMAGEFDGTSEESEAWSRSPQGQATFQSLLGGE